MKFFYSIFSKIYEPFARKMCRECEYFVKKGDTILRTFITASATVPEAEQKIKDSDNTLFELISDERTVKLVPDISEKPMLSPEDFADSFIELEGMFPPDFDAPTN